MNTVFVGNLPYIASETDLLNLFGRIGPVKRCTIVMDHVTGRSRGFGFVDMTTPADAAQAIAEFNDQQFLGRYLRLSEPHPQEFRPSPKIDSHRVHRNPTRVESPPRWS